MNTEKYVKLSKALKGFEEADTQSSSKGRVQPGTYPVTAFKKNHPDQDTDYARIVDGDENIWICMRWKDNSYATLEERTASEPLDLSNDPLAIDESALVELLPQFYEFTYDLHEATYPFQLKGCNVPQAPPATNNCCTFVEGIVAKAWEHAKGLSWSSKNHGQMMIFSADDYFSPVTCLVEENIAVPVEDDDQPPHKWTVVQGWRKQWGGGHTFIILDHHKETDRVLTLEANSAFKMDGVGYRMIGNVKDFPSPPEGWWNDANLWTWERVKSSYKFRKQCILKVNNIKWV